MAVTLNKDLKQVGNRFVVYGEVESTAAPEEATLIDFDVDLTTTVAGKTYTGFKIERVSLADHSSVDATVARSYLTWEGSTDSDAILWASGGTIDLDFTKNLDGGLINSATAPTGDLLFRREGGAANHWVSFAIQGKLTS